MRNNFNYLSSLYPNHKIDLNDPKDPDSLSKRLYQDIIDIYFIDSFFTKGENFKSVFSKKQTFNNKTFYTIFLDFNNCRHLLALDYIGPSKYWSSKIGGLSSNEIIEILKISRTIGGHMFFPRGEGSPTINQARGGASNIYDRIDWTLLSIKAFYKLSRVDNNSFGSFLDSLSLVSLVDMIEIKKNKSHFNNLFLALSTYKSYFYEFKNFEGFCDFYKLNGSFVDEDFEVKSLCPLIPIQPNKSDYLIFIKSNLESIKERNSLIFNV